MNKLNEFFDWDSFIDGKVFQVVQIGPWKDFNDKNIVYGSMITLVITEDDTDYLDPNTTNLFEKLVVKIHANMDIISKYVKLGAVVDPVGVTAKLTGRPSGTFVNFGLSVECTGFNDADGKKLI